MSEIREVLIKLGYKLTPDRDGWRTNAMFRGGDNKTALKIFPNGNWCDFVQTKKGTLRDLVRLTLGIDDIKAKGWLDCENITYDNTFTISESQQIKLPLIFSKEVVIDLIPDYKYWINRSITLKTAELFHGGLCLDSNSLLGKLKNRQILVIYNSLKQIVGFTGRALDTSNNIKWKHLGEKTNWVWPAYLNSKIISECNSVLLVESPADILRLWDCDIKNAICLFGTECSHAILTFLIKKNPKKIIISTNNEASGVGNTASLKIYNRLKRYFNTNQLQIILPDKKDFCEMSCSEIDNWLNRNGIPKCNS